SEVNRLIGERNHEHVDVLQKGSARIAPLDVPDIVEEVHGLYGFAGADILTADTFDASVSRQNGDIDLIKTFIRSAAGIARTASLQIPSPPLVALSLTSSGDCYKPWETPDQETLISEHTQNIELLAPYGDLILAETLPTLREAEVISRLANEAKRPF